MGVTHAGGRTAYGHTATAAFELMEKLLGNAELAGEAHAYTPDMVAVAYLGDVQENEATLET